MSYLCAVSCSEVVQFVHADLTLTVPNQNTVCLRGEQQSGQFYSWTAHAYNNRVQTVKNMMQYKFMLSNGMSYKISSWFEAK